MTSRTLIVVATYNEIENLPLLVDELLDRMPDADILVVDDNSPDGTGRWCRERSAVEPRLVCLHRPGKLGLGTASIAGMRYAIEHGYTYLITMDADFSHPPRYVPQLRAGMEATVERPASDVMIGSRYVAGGRIEGWPLHRRMMSRLLNLGAPWLLRLPVADCSGAFRCYRVQLLARLDLSSFYSTGYSYLEEMLWRLKHEGARFHETPITFVDRQRGQTKINWREALQALVVIVRLAFSRPARRAG